MIHIKVERKGLAVIAGKNPVVVIGHLPLFGFIHHGRSARLPKKTFEK